MKKRKCKYCKSEFLPYTTLQKNCFDPNCVTAWINDVKTKQWTKKKAQLKKELMTVQDYVKIAQQVFNKYIRLKARGGYCCSCGSELKGKFDAGHYMNANNHWSVRFDERNVWAQCVNCNQHKHGNLIEYRNFLVKHHGEDWVKQLEQDAKQTRKFTIEELKEIIDTYKKKIKDIEVGI